jgi:hypothetical protein
MAEPVEQPVFARADQGRFLHRLISADDLQEFSGARRTGVRRNNVVHRILFLSDAP